MEVQVEVTPELLSDRIGGMEELQTRSASGSSIRLGIRVLLLWSSRHSRPAKANAKRSSTSASFRKPAMEIHQLCVFAEQAGPAAGFCELLAQNGINIVTLCLAETAVNSTAFCGWWSRSGSGPAIYWPPPVSS